MYTHDVRAKYHFCASCRHFASGREDGKVYNRCARLGYDTNPKYRFDCWDPKERVKDRIARDVHSSWVSK